MYASSPAADEQFPVGGTSGHVKCTRKTQELNSDREDIISITIIIINSALLTLKCIEMS